MAKLTMNIREIGLGLVLFLLVPSAFAVTFSTDASDLWWNPNESGWGVNVIQQGDVIFATLFVYGTGSQAVWYVAPATTYTGTSSGSLVYSGPLYSTNGPYFGGAFNSGAVTNRQVGTLAFTLNTTSTGTLAYTVDGVAATKQISRQTWQVNDLSGVYVGGAAGTFSGCPTDGYQEYVANYTVTHDTSSGMTTITEVSSDGECTFSGTYVQEGRMARASGPISCPGVTGTFSASEIEAGIAGLTARVTSQFGACAFTGRFGGLRRGPWEAKWW